MSQTFYQKVPSWYTFLFKFVFLVFFSSFYFLLTIFILFCLYLLCSFFRQFLPFYFVCLHIYCLSVCPSLSVYSFAYLFLPICLPVFVSFSLPVTFCLSVCPLLSPRPHSVSFLLLPERKTKQGENSSFYDHKTNQSLPSVSLKLLCKRDIQTSLLQETKERFESVFLT